jgi:hypothetical protein
MVREGCSATSVDEYLDAVPPAQGAALRTARDRLVAGRLRREAAS